MMDVIARSLSCRLRCKFYQRSNELISYLTRKFLNNVSDQTIRNNSSNQIAPLVIPIDGSDIRNMLLRQEIFEEFMKEQIRKTKYLEKYAKHEMRGSHAGDVL
jgi:hypothetical protein